jgi:hypothetical protein
VLIHLDIANAGKGDMALGRPYTTGDVADPLSGSALIAAAEVSIEKGKARGPVSPDVLANLPLGHHGQVEPDPRMYENLS